jgi:hypothetical protein
VQTALDDFEPLLIAIAFDPIDQAIFAVDPPAPPALQALPKRFGLARPRERGSAAFLYENVKPCQTLRIVGDPIPVIISSVVGKDDLHGRINGWDLEPPA